MVEKTETRKYRKKLTSYDDALRKTPDDKNLLLEKGDIFYNLGWCENALNVYQKLLTIEPDNFEALVRSGDILFELERPKETLLYYDSALKIQADNIELLSKKGHTVHSLGKHEDALDVYQKLLTIDQSNISVLIKMADILCDIGRLNDASNAYNKALSKQEKDPVLWVKYANVLANISKNTESFKAYERANLIWSESGSYEDALRMYDHALYISPDDSGAFYFKGFVLAKLNQNTEAIESYSRAVSLLNESGLYVEALRACNNVLEIDPDNVALLFAAINILYSLERFDLALKIVGKTVRLLIKHNQFEEALDVCDNGLELKPNDATFLGMKGYTLYKNGQYASAFQICEKTLMEEPLDSLSLVIKGNILSKDKSKIAESVGEYKNANWIWNKFSFHDEAIEMCDDALEDNAKDVGALYFKGIALECLGKRDNALEFYKKAIPLFIEAKLHDDALEACDNALEIEPEDLILWKYLINIHHDLEHYEEEAKCCCKVAELYYIIAKSDKIKTTKSGYFNRSIKKYETAAEIFNKIEQSGAVVNVYHKIHEINVERKRLNKFNGKVKPLIPKHKSDVKNIKTIAFEDIGKILKR